MNRSLQKLTVPLALLLASCSHHPSDNASAPRPAEVKAQIARLLPEGVSDRQGWAGDIYVAFNGQNLPPSVSNLCAVIAVTGQESNFSADAAVTGLPKIAWGEIDRRAAQHHIPSFLVRTALLFKSPTGKSYADRLDHVKSEKELSAVFDDLIDMVPMGQKLFGHLNPIHTGGPMQVSIAFAESHAKDYPYPVDGSIRREVFTRRGGLWFGTMHLLAYPANYSTPLYRFADFNAGRYASRNVAFQAAVSRLSGIKLALDGDLINYGSDSAGGTEKAVRLLGKRLDHSDRAIRRALEKGDSDDFDKTDLWQAVFALADKDAGKKLPREMLPGIKLESPKITRNLTTAWFAQRVNSRYQKCLSRH
ncbi:DUF1615 domain-containing protein [Erwinia amylovora]|uniref:Lipoprotein n=4 Tax=Erwinia amylovora TaxID=552 RepID=A0A831ERW4_ERWAM|nr:DUF1615 domain-containing protein [Erwinia amylovora]CDK14759.1 putative protein yaiW [Erwinia amylovora LA635]CDK18127.1 putative protein yaiW [Erwinia amylovora LA636]CDK21496.1 putative protein yaiW [Erwinia amylovora LA637]ATZ11087.1 DUF1615 domain-containing protein [Erwinia amylovora]EKV53928.1 hypothetical protein EaACW_1228 [Erwinia amylovora ACW56400]